MWHFNIISFIPFCYNFFFLNNFLICLSLKRIHIVLSFSSRFLPFFHLKGMMERGERKFPIFPCLFPTQNLWLTFSIISLLRHIILLEQTSILWYVQLRTLMSLSLELVEWKKKMCVALTRQLTTYWGERDSFDLLLSIRLSTSHKLP